MPANVRLSKTEKDKIRDLYVEQHLGPKAIGKVIGIHGQALLNPENL